MSPGLWLSVLLSETLVLFLVLAVAHLWIDR